MTPTETIALRKENDRLRGDLEWSDKFISNVRLFVSDGDNHWWSMIINDYLVEYDKRFQPKPKPGDLPTGEA